MSIKLALSWSAAKCNSENNLFLLETFQAHLTMSFLYEKSLTQKMLHKTNIVLPFN